MTQLATRLAILSMGWYLLMSLTLTLFVEDFRWYWLIIGSVATLTAALGVIGTIVFPPATWVVAGLLCVFTFAPALIGMPFIPGAVLMIAAAATQRRSRPRGSPA